ncbi:TPA: ead/Ea22-like family protein [Citrobacter braakii]|nr:ead/Ea22-like family protein [Citrobacter braakii]
MTALNKQALRERYSEKPAPKCHICGSAMTIQRAGAGGVVYGCTGRIDKDGEGYKFAEGRDFADDHYARSRVTVADESDPDVLALLDELEAAEKRIAELEARTVTLPPKEHDNGTDSQIDINAGFANRMWQKCYDAIRAAGIITEVGE